MVYDEMEKDYTEVIEGGSLWKLDGPIGRWSYFKTILKVLLLPLLMWVVAFILPVESVIRFLGIIIALLSLYLIFIATVKRFYDVMGSLKSGLILAIVSYVLGFFIHIIGLITFIVLFFIPGKLVKS